MEDWKKDMIERRKEEVAEDGRSYTGQFIKEILRRKRA